MIKTKFSIFIIIVTFLLGVKYSQGADSTSVQTKLSIGFQAIPSATKWWANDLFARDYRLGLGSGITVSYYLKPRLAICANINYERKGFSSNSTFTDVNGNVTGMGTSKYYFDYATVPAFLKLKLNDGNTVFSINLGLYTGYLIKVGGNNVSPIISPSDFSRFDVGILGGLNLDIPVGEKLFLSLETRECLGLKTMALNNMFESPKNQSIAAIVGLHYKL